MACSRVNFNFTLPFYSISIQSSPDLRRLDLRRLDLRRLDLRRLDLRRLDLRRLDLRRLDLSRLDLRRSALTPFVPVSNILNQANKLVRTTLKMSCSC